MFFTPTQSPLPSLNYEPNQPALAPLPSRPSPPYQSWADTSTSPGFSLHSIDEWQRRVNEDLNQIYCTIRRNQDITKLRESGRLISPQPEPRPRSSHHLYRSSSPSREDTYLNPNCLQSLQYRSQQDLTKLNSHLLQPSHLAKSVQPLLSLESLKSLQPIVPRRQAPPPPIERAHSYGLSSLSSDITSSVMQSNSHVKTPSLRDASFTTNESMFGVPSNSGYAVYAVPTKKSTLIEQTLYDRERFDAPKVLHSWDNVTSLSRFNHNHESDRSASLQRVNSLRNTRTNDDSDSLGVSMRAAASLGDIHSATWVPAVEPRGDSIRSAPTKFELQLDQDVNNVRFAQEDEDDLDKLIKKIEQDAVIQDEIGK